MRIVIPAKAGIQSLQPFLDPGFRRGDEGERTVLQRAAEVTGSLITIRSQKDFPEGAYVAVRHRGWWFYIADDDSNAKATFALVNVIFSLQSATGKGKSPVLTLPVGR